MVITVLAANVAPEKTSVLKQRFEAGAKQIPPQMVQAFLVSSSEDPSLWHLIAIWRSRSALMEYRQSVDTPEGILMFRAAGAEPKQSVYDVEASAASAL